MPTDVAIVIAGTVVIFAVFAAALAWADFRTRGFRAPGATYFDKRQKDGVFRTLKYARVVRHKRGV